MTRPGLLLGVFMLSVAIAAPARADFDQGFEVDVRDPYSFYMGSVQLVVREREEFVGVADARRDGEARGPRK